MQARPSDIRLSQHSSGASGAGFGCSSGSADESIGQAWGDGGATATPAPDAPELLRLHAGPRVTFPMEGPDSSVRQLSGDLQRTAQVRGLEPPRVPGEGRGENGVWGEDSQNSKASLPQDTAARGSTDALQAHVCSKAAQNEVQRLKRSGYPDCVAHPDTASKNAGVSPLGVA